MVKKKQIPELKVLFDTNVLYTQAASDLVKLEIAQLIQEHSNYIDHKISWHLPDIVRHERQYQMQKAGRALIPSINKLEKLLGHNLAITEDILNKRVDDAVECQLTQLKLNLVKINVSKVNWEQIMLNAVYRRPPFDPGDREKGFRDALVIESLLMLISQSPVTATVCRVIFISDDKLLNEAAKSATDSSSNVRILNTLEELRGLINTLVSEVDENFVEEVQVKAGPYFFEKDNKSTMYFKEDLRTKIKEQFSQELNAMPEGVTETEAETWYIGKPRFVKKEGQRIFWVSRIEPTFSGFTIEYKQPQNALASLGFIAAAQAASGMLNNLPSLQAVSEKKLAMKYGVVFEVDWSVTYGQHKKFSTAKIEDIRYIETLPRKDN